MTRKLGIALVLSLFCGILSGCIVYDGGGYYHHPHYWHDRW